MFLNQVSFQAPRKWLCIFVVLIFNLNFLFKSGLVIFYGDTNHTVYMDSALKAPAAEKMRKCFKFVRIARFGAQESDLIVAATYHYKEQQTFKSETGELIDRSAEVVQEIWMGKFTAAGKMP